jgi:hypothetical protein
MSLACAANIVSSMGHQIDHLRTCVGIDKALSAFPYEALSTGKYGWQEMNDQQLSALIFSTFAFFFDEEENVLIAGPIGGEPCWMFQNEKWARIP